MSKDGKKKIYYKRIITIGQNLIANRQSETAMFPKVQCNRSLVADVNQCMHCEFNEGLLNHYVMQCSRPLDAEIPKYVTEEPDYEPKDQEGKD